MTFRDLLFFNFPTFTSPYAPLDSSLSMKQYELYVFLCNRSKAQERSESAMEMKALPSLSLSPVETSTPSTTFDPNMERKS